MKPRLGSFDIQWLLAPTVGNVEVVDDSYDVRRIDFSLDPSLGEAYAENLNLGPGFDLYRAVHHLERAKFGHLVPILETRYSLPETSFGAQIWLSGMGCHEEYWHGRNAPPVEILARPGHDTFRLHTSRDVRVLVEGGGTSEMRSLVISLSNLEAMVGASASDQLLENLGLNKSHFSVVTAIQPFISIPLKNAFAEGYTGRTRRLFAQARALEYLGGLIDYLNSNENPKPVPRRHSMKIRELKEYLVSLEGRLPTLSQLAKDFGLSAKQLSVEFNNEFGESIFAFVTSQRLEQTHALLLDTNIPMKLIAERFGYSHVNHFITAFRKKFGYPPGSLRKKR